MLHIDITSALAKTLTPSVGISDQEFLGLRTSMKRFIGEVGSERDAGKHSWMNDIADADMINAVKDIAKRLKQERIQTVVWVGIGGSGLGPKVLQEVFETPNTIEFVLVDTIDPFALQQILDIVDWKHTAIAVVSKSGETLETMSAFFLLWEALKDACGRDKAAQRVIAITDAKNGYLHELSIDEGFEILPIPAGTGGRYSIFTAVGLLPLAIFDADIDAFIEGAVDMDRQCTNEILEDNPAALLAGTQFLLDTKKGYLIRVIMPYAQRLHSIARWDQQLVAESLGKNEVHNPFPLAAVGTQDQHSLLQQWTQGPRKSWHLFISEIEKPRLTVPSELDSQWQHIAGKSFGQLLDACLEGTARGLTAAKRPHVTLSVTRLDAYHLGQIFYCLLMEVVLLGKLYRIDPYGQPGVELSKKFANDLLSRGRSE